MNGDNIKLPEELTLRDRFATHAPEPSGEAVKVIAESELMANPHGDYHKAKRRSWDEIRCSLRYQYADAMLEARKK